MTDHEPTHPKDRLEAREYDALAELFLGDSPYAPPAPTDTEQERIGDDPPGPADDRPTKHDVPREPRRAGDRRKSAPIELIVLGHLPVRASLWVREYASTVAGEQTGPVALLRLAPELASVDLIGPTGSERLGPAPTLGDAIRRARLDAARYLIRVEETAEPALSESEAIDRVTILTGADEAALVASYRLVKSLAGAWDRQFAEDEGPELRLAILGAQGAAAEAAAEKLARAAESFLRRPVEISICAAKIGSVPSRTLYRGEADENASDVLELIRPNTSEPRGSELRLVGAAPAGPPESPVKAPAERSDDAPRPEVVVRTDAARAAERRHATNEPTENPGPAPTGGDEAPSAPTPDAQRGLLCSRLEGLVPLESQCPFTTGVELGADRDGSLHLLTTGGPDIAAGVDRLIAVAAWTRAHLSLLLRAEPALAQPHADRAAASEPTLHLFVADAPSARSLLDSDIRVHLAREIETGDGAVVLVDDLN